MEETYLSRLYLAEVAQGAVVSLATYLIFRVVLVGVVFINRVLPVEKPGIFEFFILVLDAISYLGAAAVATVYTLHSYRRFRDRVETSQPELGTTKVQRALPKSSSHVRPPRR